MWAWILPLNQCSLAASVLPRPLHFFQKKVVAARIAYRGGMPVYMEYFCHLVPFFIGVRDHRQAQCPCAHWQWMGVIQWETRHYSHAGGRDTSLTCCHTVSKCNEVTFIRTTNLLRNLSCFMGNQGEKSISVDIFTFYKESWSSERGGILPETTLLTKVGLISVVSPSH